jgi:hypothetical protein
MKVTHARPFLFTLLTAMVIAALAVALSLRVRAQSADPANVAAFQTARQYITPTAMRGAVQQLLNPGVPAYPNFVAGEAVRSQLSPDGKRWPFFARARTRSISRTATSIPPLRPSSSSCTT